MYGSGVWVPQYLGSFRLSGPLRRLGFPPPPWVTHGFRTYLLEAPWVFLEGFGKDIDRPSRILVFDRDFLGLG
jgi:hypothetical protein